MHWRLKPFYRILDGYVAFKRFIALGILSIYCLISLLHLLKANCPICWVVPCLRLASAQRSRDQSPTFKSRYQTDTKPFCPLPGPARCPAPGKKLVSLLHVVFNLTILITVNLTQQNIVLSKLFLVFRRSPCHQPPAFH